MGSAAFWGFAGDGRQLPPSSRKKIKRTSTAASVPAPARTTRAKYVPRFATPQPAKKMEAHHEYKVNVWNSQAHDRDSHRGATVVTVPHLHLKAGQIAIKCHMRKEGDVGEYAVVQTRMVAKPGTRPPCERDRLNGIDTIAL